EARDLDPIHPHLAPVGPVQGDGVAEQHGLPGARASQDDHGLPPPDGEVHPRQHGPAGERLVEVHVADERVRHWKSRKALVRKKSEMITAMEAHTTVWVVAFPTPSAPPVAVIPL